MKPWLLIDSDYLCHRARWSMGNLSWQGKPTAVIYGFLQTVLQLQNQFNTNNIAFCFDSRHSKRREIYPFYKNNRKRKELTKPEEEFEKQFYKQIKLLRTSYLHKIGFNNVFIQRGYESDDLIAKLIKTVGECDVIIISSDEDLFQCLCKNVSIYNPQKRMHMTLRSFKRVYGITPDQWITVKCIAGCSTDNINGLVGVGEKTAIKFLQKTLNKNTRIYRLLDSPATKAMLCRNLPLIALPFVGTKKMELVKDNITRAGWRRVCKQLGFKSIIDNVPRDTRNENRR